MQESINNQSMLKVGTILHGTYRIDSYLSSGGFGNTYVATNIEFDERVAIKEFFMKGVTQRDDNQTTVSVSNLENTNSFQEQKEKFKKEARRLRKLQNEHIVKVHDMFDENGTAYYVMDYVDGENLSERLKRTGRPMTESEVSLLLPQILDALKAVHNEGFCHLDIKPSNTMLDKGGKIKLIDFGASKQLGANGTLTTNAPTAFAQTPGYAPREQMEQNLDNIGPWTDIYALGATLYNLLTNKRPPMPTDIDDDISDDKHLALPFPDSIGDLRFLVLQMMKTNRLQRPQSIDAIMEAEKMRKEEPKLAPQQQPTPKPSAVYDDEETIIAEPKPKREEKKPEPEPEPKVYSQPTQSSYTHVSHVSNDSDSSGKGYFIGILVFVIVIVIILANNRGCENRTQEVNQQSVENAEPQTVEKMSWESPLGSCQYSGPVDEQGIPHGLGKANFNDGRYYKGDFEHGVLTGDNCFFMYSNGDVFEGKFRNNRFHYGTYTIASDKSYFVGYYKNGQPDGGTWYNKNGKEIEKI
jgi:serine/threonine protein kinase